MAHLLGLKAGLTELSSGDLEALIKVDNQSLSIDRHLVKKAFEKTLQPSEPYVIAEFKKFIKKRRSLMFLRHFALNAHPFAVKPPILWLQRDPCVYEAYLIELQTLTDLRLLLSSIADKISLKILLCGQENLKDILKRSSHDDLVQRIPHRISLHALANAQKNTYIDSRFTFAGGTNKTFDPEAKDFIHDYTGGVTRQINNVAAACLINAASWNIKKTETLVASDNLGLLGSTKLIFSRYRC